MKWCDVIQHWHRSVWFWCSPSHMMCTKKLSCSIKPKFTVHTLVQLIFKQTHTHRQCGFDTMTELVLSHKLIVGVKFDTPIPPVDRKCSFPHWIFCSITLHHTLKLIQFELNWVVPHILQIKSVERVQLNWRQHVFTSFPVGVRDQDKNVDMHSNRVQTLTGTIEVSLSSNKFNWTCYLLPHGGFQYTVIIIVTTNERYESRRIAISSSIYPRLVLTASTNQTTTVNTDR